MSAQMGLHGRIAAAASNNQTSHAAKIMIIANPDAFSNLLRLIDPLSSACKEIMNTVDAVGSGLKLLRLVSKGVKDALLVQGYTLLIDGVTLRPAELPNTKFWASTNLITLRVKVEEGEHYIDLLIIRTVDQ